MDRPHSRLSYWFPKLEAAGLPVPKTIIVPMHREAQRNVWAALDGKHGTAEQGAASLQFVSDLRGAADSIGFPCFLRTDHTSGKHGWENTCFLPAAESIPSHILAIAEYSAMAGIMGLPFDVWVVRELLPTKPFGVCPNYGNMPICKEFRFFVEDGLVRCHHPYWPLGALEQGGANPDLDYELLCWMGNTAELYVLASAAGKAVGGRWSVDLLETEKGWFITDMAEAEKSFHWERCPHA
jgi:hypothetical protein